MNEWKKITLGDVAVLSYGKMPKKELLGQGKYPTFSGYKYLYLYPMSNCKKGDVIVVARGVGGTGDVKLVKEDAYLTNLSIKIELDSEIINNNFFYYYFYKQTLRYLDSGSAQSQITIQDLENESFLFPPLSEQKAIASVFTCLDSKIDLLQNQNKTLEQIAQTLFKHWFVDFEFPNKNGHPYKSSGGKMVESELGEIPLNWIIKPLDEIADFLNGLAMQKYRPLNPDDYLPVIKIRELKNGITESTERADSNINKEYIIDYGDVIFSWSGSLGVVLWNNGKGALNQHLFKVTSKTYPKWFYYLWIIEHMSFFQQIAQSKATTMGHIKRQHLKESLCLIPETEQLNEMNGIFNPLINKIVSNYQELNTLTKVRDLLLPKLMSGQIRVN